MKPSNRRWLWWATIAYLAACVLYAAWLLLDGAGWLQVLTVFECASPTCMARTVLFIPPTFGSVRSTLELRGWVLQQQPGDDRPLPYCPRCWL